MTEQAWLYWGLLIMVTRFADGVFLSQTVTQDFVTSDCDWVKDSGLFAVHCARTSQWLL